MQVEFWDWFQLHGIEPVSSAEAPLVQVADLFLGLAIYSREQHAKLEQWQGSKVQNALFDVKGAPDASLSGADQQRCQLLHEFDGYCKARKLGVSLKSSKMLKTMNPKNPINFWWWESQHENDKAPLRVKVTRK